MTDFEILNHAKKYIDKMANGINPLTDEPVKEDDLINNIRISRCLFYVSGVLDKALQNGFWAKEKKVKKPKKSEFSLSEDRLSVFRFSDKPIPVSEFSERINELIDPETMKKFSYKEITSWMLDRGFLETYTNMYGREGKRPTPEGEKIGIHLETRRGSSGEYFVTVYDRQAQQFIIDNFRAISEKPEEYGSV